jgi:hypothetical protein
VFVLCCQIEFSATGLSHVQRTPTDCGASLSVIVKPRNWEVMAQWGLSNHDKKIISYLHKTFLYPAA